MHVDGAGVIVDANRAADVMSYGIGAGAIVAGLALFSYATRKEQKGTEVVRPRTIEG